jgi:arginine decarboxylase
MFLLGAYQEILGDLHNLFGDTNAVHVSIHEDGYKVDHVLEGDTVTDVLGYVEFQRHDLVEKMRQATEKALRRKLLTLEESAMLISRYTQGLAGYTYLQETPRRDASDPLARAMAKLKGGTAGNGRTHSPAPKEAPSDSQAK